MCGIIGYLGKKDSVQILIEGLKRLEYRGYDSAGIATINNKGAVEILKQTGRVKVLEQEVGKAKIKGSTGISHTRWATHGRIENYNAHPHASYDGKFAMVHNGVIENFKEIRTFLSKHEVTFKSETDSEVLVNLIAFHYENDAEGEEESSFLESVRKSLAQVQGTYGIAIICSDYPEEMIGARRSSPLVIGVGAKEHMIASDVSAFAHLTRDVVYLNDGEIVHIKDDAFSISTVGNQVVEAIIEKVDWNIEDSELGEFQHYMEKEIFEQPSAIENAFRGRFSDDNSTAHFGGLNLTPAEFRQVDRIVFCACGTAWHACLIAEHLIERFARIPVEVEYASEFRYRNAPLDKNTLVFVISQSGETIDTLAALREAQRKGYKTLAITNVVGSTIARESDGGIYQRAGPEIGVASTKAFTSQLTIVAMLALYLGRMRDMSYEAGLKYVKAIKEVPDQIKKILDQKDKIQAIAKKYAQARNCLFLGRQSMFPIALEGALKLKEISYIHAEGYPAAELKHGPIALICPECPSVFLAPYSEVYQKTLSNIQEVKARKGPVIAITSEKRDFPSDLIDHLIQLPEAHEAVQPILTSIAIQILSYYIALERGCDVDKPRNLAKSVTVE